MERSCVPLGLALSNPDNQYAISKLTHNRLYLIDGPQFGAISQQIETFIENQIITPHLFSLNFLICFQSESYSDKRLYLVYEQLASRLFRLLQPAPDIRFLELYITSAEHSLPLPCSCTEECVHRLEFNPDNLVTQVQYLFVEFPYLERKFTLQEARQLSHDFRLLDIFPNLRILCINGVFLL